MSKANEPRKEITYDTFQKNRLSLWWFMVEKDNLKQLINLNFIDLTNQTYSCGKYDLPYVRCPKNIEIDYLALYSEVNNYHKTENTCVCFYQFDIKYDNINGLFEAIYYDNKKLLAKYKERFKGVKYAISPDYSQVGDINRIENIYRLFKARIVSIWLLIECDVLVIPNITYANDNYFDVMLDGMEDTEVVAFSIKGSMKNKIDRKLLSNAIKITVDTLKKLGLIIVYSVSKNDEIVHNLFEYASLKGIKVIIPNNILKERNIIKKEVEQNGKN